MEQQDKLRVDEDLDAWDPMQEHYESKSNSLAMDSLLKDPLSALTGSLVRPIEPKIGDITICERFAKYGDCADKQYCDKIHIDDSLREQVLAMQDNCDYNRDRTLMNVTHLLPQDLEINPEAALLVEVTGIQSPGNFYFLPSFGNLNVAQFNEQDFQFYIERLATTSTTRTKLDECHKQLASVFDQSYRLDNIDDRIYLSQVVACRNKDGRFRRATVIGLPDYSMEQFNYKLLLIDLGIFVELPRHDIYDIKSRFLNEPPLAINCRLPVKPPRGSQGWSSDAISLFEQLCAGNQFLLCKLLDYWPLDSLYVVDLLDIKTRSSFADRLLREGLADKC